MMPNCRSIIIPAKPVENNCSKLFLLFSNQSNIHVVLVRAKACSMVDIKVGRTYYGWDDSLGSCHLGNHCNYYVAEITINLINDTNQ